MIEPYEPKDMTRNLFQGYWLEVTRLGSKTKYVQCYWSADGFTPDGHGLELTPGVYGVSLYERGTLLISNAHLLCRRWTTLVGLYVGGTNPHKKPGEAGILTYPAKLAEYLKTIPASGASRPGSRQSKT